MDLARWKKIEDIFQEALDLDADARAKFIDEKSGGDAELRGEVEKLIARYETDESFLESPVWTDSRLFQPSLKQRVASSLDDEIVSRNGNQSFIGQQIGAFRLVKELGKGGMGMVYLAERADGEFQQKVAVKLIKRGMDSDFIVKRFRHERQILANLNHPNIARLLDGGTTSDSLPYFIMEFVEGVPFLKFSGKNNLELREKLKLFLAVCEAVAYAHKRKIIHRDIKPSNIIVTDEGTPKLLDFGIAKILDPDSIHESVMPTGTQMRLMTPEYASPEQARGEEITPASDQYSLGVLLYELITGMRPYKFSSRSPHEIARVICEEIPSEPSSGEFGKIITESENFDFDKDFCKKLDRIVLKALRKNPAERYGSVEEFADDIRNFLRNQPVRAAAPETEINKSDFPTAPENEPKQTSVLTGENISSPVTAPVAKTISPRRKGVKQGLFAAVISFLLFPFLIFVVAGGLLPGRFAVLTFLLIFVGGLARAIYALIFESGEANLTILSLNENETGEAATKILPSSGAHSTMPEGEKPATADDISFSDKSIAVLPFKILAISAGQETDEISFLGMGLADALITRLSNVRQFVVRPTSSVLRYGKMESDSFSAGKELNAKYILDGTIVRVGNRIRVSVQLLDVALQSTVWAERFDENFTDVMQLEDAISSKVAESLVPQLSTGEIKELAKRGTDIPEAYEAYLRGRVYWNAFTEDGFRQAILYYKKAVELDPNYTLALAGIADYYIWLGIYGILPPKNSYQPAIETATRAVALDDKLPEAYAALGFAQLCGNYDWEIGEANIRRAVELSPNYAIAHNWLAILLYTAGRFDEGIRHAEKAVRLDPLTYQNYRTLSWGYYFSRRYPQALELINATIEKFPTFGVAYFNLSWALRAVGRTDEGLEASQKAMEMSGGNIFVLLGHAQALAAAGKLDEAESLIEKFKVENKERYISYYQIALVYCYAKEKEKSLDALEKALSDREGWLVWLGVEAALDFLRTEPRFIALQNSINSSFASQRFLDAATAQKNGKTNLAAAKSVADAAGSKTSQEKINGRKFSKPVKYIARASVFLLIFFGIFFVRNLYLHLTFNGGSDSSVRKDWNTNFASTMNIRQFTSTGKEVLSAISPNGLDIAYVSLNNEQQTLWLRGIAGDAAPRQLLAPTSDIYLGLTFSPDGKNIYYTKLESNYVHRHLYKISADGQGEGEKVAENVMTAAGISADGGKIVFYALSEQSPRAVSLYTGDLSPEGKLSSSSELVTLAHPEYFLGNPVFSADGKKIIYAANTFADEQRATNLFVFDMESKTNEKLNTAQFFDIAAIAPRGDTNEVVVCAGESASAPKQLWLIDYKSGETHRLTNDLNDYISVSLDKNSTTIVSSEDQKNSNLWIAGLNEVNDNTSNAKPLTEETNRHYGLNGLRWTTGGQIVYVGGEKKNSVYLINPDGSNNRTINLEDSLPSEPQLSADNRFLYFIDEKQLKSAVWRYDLSTGSRLQITNETSSTPVVTFDDKYLVYVGENEDHHLQLYLIPTGGGESVKLAPPLSLRPAVSPDSRLVAYYFRDAEAGGKWAIGITKLEENSSPRLINLPTDANTLLDPFNRPLEWSPDGNWLYYLNDKNGVSNIFKISASGNNQVKQLTNFTTGRIFNFSVSPDGKQAILARGATASNVVIFKAAQ